MIRGHNFIYYTITFLFFSFIYSAKGMLSKQEDPDIGPLVPPLQAINLNNPPVIPQNNQALPHPLLNILPPQNVRNEDSEDEDNYQYQPPQAQKKLDLPMSFQEELKSINLQFYP